MRTSIIAFVILCGVIAGAVVFLNHQKTAAPIPIVESSPAQNASPEKTAVPVQETAPAVLPVVVKQAQNPVPTPVVNAAKPDASTNAIAKMVDALLSAKNGPQKHELFQQLIKSGQIDQAIAELKQRATDNPNDPEILTTLGEAQINKVGAIHAAGGDINEQGILAMQADQSFNAALKIDPSNFEAQLVKSISMSYWPAEPTRDAQVVQTLSSLIDRQESMPSRSDFAQAYIYLGNEYQKIGQPDKAAATWQLGAQKFPNDPTLQGKINGL